MTGKADTRHDHERQLRDINEALLVSSTLQHELMEQSQNAEAALRTSEEQLAVELAATQRLQELSTRMIGEDSVEAMYEHVLDAAVAIMRSDFASIQMLYPERGAGGELRLLGHRGFSAEAARFWEWVTPATESCCGVALRTGERCVVPDVETCGFMAGTEDLAAYLQTDIHAVQTTPLLSRRGQLLGMISTHWRQPREPSEHELRLLDVLARQAADLIERTQAEAELRSAGAQKDQFLGLVSHELRTPISTVLANGLLLLRNGEKLRPDDRQQALTDIVSEAGKLQGIIENLLLLTRLDVTGAIQFDPLSMRELIEQQIDSFSRRYPARKISFDAPSDATVRGQPALLGLVLENLISNAHKYSPEETPIELTLRVSDDGQAEVLVRDYGTGLDESEMEDVFTPFYRSENGRQMATGMGLGLPASRRIIDAHKGSLSVAARPGGGCDFIFSLPTGAQLITAQGPAVD